MTQIRNLAEAEEVLASYIPQVKELLGKDLTLIRMQPLMAALGDPQEKLRIIHVAGTSGKTSTCYYIASLLKQAGLKVGLTVSPHVDSITERIQLNLTPLPEAEFCQALGQFLDLIGDVEPQPTYFELIIAFVYWYFAKQGIACAVIETGLGGSFDATNIVHRPDKVCVITDIGYDHMHVLGHTLPEIASQKAGIIQQANEVCMHAQAPEIQAVIEARVRQQAATLHITSDDEQRTGLGDLPALAALPLFQQRNWLLAQSVYDLVRQRDELPKLDNMQLTESMAIQVPGRMDTRKLDGKTLVMDGAHNEQKMQAFVSSFQARYPGPRVPILLAMKTGKDHEAVLPLLKPICSELIVTSFHLSQDTPIVSMPAATLGALAEQQGFGKVTVIDDPQAACRELLTRNSPLLLITGSFYLLSCIRPVFDRPPQF